MTYYGTIGNHPPHYIVNITMIILTNFMFMHPSGSVKSGLGTKKLMPRMLR